MNNKSLIKKLVEAFDFGKLKPKNQTVQQSTMKLSLQRMNDYNKELEKTVDLDLPSGTLWCKFNVGAENESETEYGDYFAWGDTDPKDEYSWAIYKWGTRDNLTKYNGKDRLTLLLPKDDAATVNMGLYWCMPTKEQLQELIDNTTSEWVEDYKGSGVNGRLFTGKTNGNTLFFPAAGYKIGSLHLVGSACNIWSSTLLSHPGDNAFRQYFDRDGTGLALDERYFGLVVRAVFNG